MFERTRQNIQNDDIKHKFYDVNKCNVQYQCHFSVLASLLRSAKKRQDKKELGLSEIYRQFNEGCIQFHLKKFKIIPCKLTGKLLTYDILKNRWCENIGRPHKSNHIMYKHLTSLSLCCKICCFTLVIWWSSFCTTLPCDYTKREIVTQSQLSRGIEI